MYFVEHTFVEASFEAMSDFFATEFAVDVNADDDRIESRIVGFDRFIMRVVVGNFDSAYGAFYSVDISLIVAVVVGISIENMA